MKPSSLFPYFQSLGIGKNPGAKLVVIDSVTTKDSPNIHSVIKTSIAIRKHLLNMGWQERAAIDDVITIGMPESPDSQQSYRITDFSSYKKQVHQIDRDHLDEAVFPYLDPGIRWFSAPFRSSYSFEGNFYYWNGKYHRLDDSGMPLGAIHFTKMIQQFHDVSSLHNFLLGNATKIYVYNKIIQAILQNKEELLDKINYVSSQHQ